MRVLVVGAGVGGLASTLLLAQQGHDVTLVERDDTPMPASADEAFDWDRRGAPQVRHSHAFLARLVGLLRRDHPKLYEDLLAEGATEMRFGDDIPPTMVGFEPLAADGELVMLACRRTTFEWVVRRAVLAEPGVTIRVGAGVVGLRHGAGRVTGVVLDSGDELAADLVVVAVGRRSALPEWLEAAGFPSPPEQGDDTGIVYFSRFYRLADDADYPPRGGPIGGDLGYLKYGTFVGDNRTFSVTLAAPSSDDELRRRLADPATFDRCAALLVATAPYLDGRARPITPTVHVMAGLVNRWRDHMPDGALVAPGVVAVGDAVLCSNPLYGRGCAFAFWGARLLADAVDADGNDVDALARRYYASLGEHVYPWYRSGVEQDAEARRVAAALLAGDDPDADAGDPRTFMRSVFRDGLLPALRSDAVVLRAFFRNFNLLTPPDALVTDPDVGARVLAAWNDRANRPPAPRLGPATRAELIALLG